MEFVPTPAVLEFEPQTSVHMAPKLFNIIQIVLSATKHFRKIPNVGFSEQQCETDPVVIYSNSHNGVWKYII